MVNEDIVKIRERMYSIFPNIAYLTFNRLTHEKEITTGDITLHLLDGKIKICSVSFVPKTDKFELREK